MHAQHCGWQVHEDFFAEALGRDLHCSRAIPRRGRRVLRAVPDATHGAPLRRRRRAVLACRSESSRRSKRDDEGYRNRQRFQPGLLVKGEFKMDQRARLRGRLRGILACGVGLLSGCSASDQGSVETRAEAIVNGTPDSAHPNVVELYGNFDTGTIVALLKTRSGDRFGLGTQNRE